LEKFEEEEEEEEQNGEANKVERGRS